MYGNISRTWQAETKIKFKQGPRKAANQLKAMGAESNSTIKRLAMPMSPEYDDFAKPPTAANVNGYRTTLPPALPEADLDSSKSDYHPKNLFRTGKTYVTFYKGGIKALWSNFKFAFRLEQFMDARYKHDVSAAIAAGYLDRSRFQLLRRSSFDVKRVPPFLLIFLLCGEFTPLVVMAVSGVVPFVCRIPKQIDGDRKKLEARRAISFRNLVLDGPTAKKTVQDLGRMELIHICWSCGLSSSVWDWLGGQYPGLPTPILRRKVHNHVQYLGHDDTLIQKHGGVSEMIPDEVYRSCVERGIDVVGRSEEKARKDLRSWLQAREKATAESLLMTR